MTREKFSNWIRSGFFTVKKLSFWLQTSLSEPNFWLAPLWGQLGMAHPLRLTGVKSADFYPPNSRFWYFLGFFWLGYLEILVLAMPKSLEAIAVKKSPKMYCTFFCEKKSKYVRFLAKKSPTMYAPWGPEKHNLSSLTYRISNWAILYNM